LVIVLYLGKLTNGKVFDSLMDENQKPNLEKSPFAVTIGTGSVIKGWDDGLIGVKEGMVRKLSIPWELAYGTEGKDPIPPKADLLFTIKVLKVYKAGAKPEIDAVDVKQGSGAKVTANSTIKFHYTGSLANGKVYDDQSKGLELAVSRLIPGFREAVVGMQVGGERKITFPPNSPNPTGQIPPSQPFEIDVTIDAVK
jgi:FKBP-type peptidyl-prolyl cis-trans isomerase